MDAIKIQVRVDMYLPRWQEAAGSALEPEWNAFASALRVHEAGHQQLAFDAADQVYRAISDVPPDPNCGQVNELADQAANGALDAVLEQEIGYDNDTDHGASQGVDF